MTSIFTIGHSRHTAEHFVSLLRANEIERFVDVRSHPASRWAPQFGKAALAQALGAHAIDYVFLGRELGGRPNGAEFYREDGAVDYERRAEASDFKRPGACPGVVLRAPPASVPGRCSSPSWC